MSDRFSSVSQTTTDVTDRQTLLRERHKAYALEQYALSGLQLYAQVAIGLALYLYGHVSTPSYLALALLLPFTAGLMGGALWLCRRRQAGETPLASAVGKPLARVLAVTLALCALLDAQLAAYSLSAILSEVLPNVSSLWVALAVAVVTALAIGGGDEYGLPRLARLLRWLLGLMIGFCAVTAMPHGSLGHLAPWLGRGMGSVLQGALWITGSVATSCLPLLTPQRETALQALCDGGKTGLRTVLLSLTLGMVTALISAFLLPFYALARPETLGWRLLLLSDVSPSLVGWSLLLCGLLMLLLMAQAAGVTRAASLICWAAGKETASPFLITVLLMMLLPLSALASQDAETLLRALAPWRGAGVAAVLLMGGAGSLIRQRRRKA